jgi:aspartate 1-decarboxylase
MLQIVRAKLHGISVTGSDLDYHGSITLDPDHCTMAGIRPLEFVDIFNKNNGARFCTYVIFGEAGSGCCVLNGASARQCQKNDQLIICASSYMEEEKLYDVRPKVLTFAADNTVSEISSYEVFESERRPFDFAMRIEETADAGRKIGRVDVKAFREDLRARGLGDHAVADIIARHLKAVA